MRLITLTLLILLCVPGAWGINYYVDKDATGADPTTKAGAYQTLYTAMSAAHSAGDTIFVCPSHTETLSSNISIASNGAWNSYIIVQVDNGVEWPDSSGTPVITCGAYYIFNNYKSCWHIDGGNNGLELTGYSNRAISFSEGFVTISDCKLTAPVANGDYGIVVAGGCDAKINNCEFDGTATGTGTGIYVDSATATITNCVFDDLQYAINAGHYGSTIYADECVLGQDTANTDDINTSTSSRTYLRDCFMNSHTSPNYNMQYTSETQLHLWDSYLDDSKRPNSVAAAQYLIMSTDYDNGRSGSDSDYSLKFDYGTSYTGSPSDPSLLVRYTVSADSAEARTYSIYSKRTGGDVDGLYMEVIYYDADTLKTDTIVSDMTNTSTWYAMTSDTITPNHDGPVYVDVYCSGTINNPDYYIDPVLIATGEQYNAISSWGVPSLAFNYVEPEAGNGQIWIWN